MNLSYLSMKKIYIFLIAIILCSLLVSQSARATSSAGTVYAPYSSCSYFLILDPTGSFSEVEWYGGSFPDSGDVVYGDFQTYGFKDMYDQNKGNNIRVWVDNYWISRSRAAQYLTDKCSGYSFNPYSLPPTTYYSAPLPTPITCPLNSHSVGGICTCDSGYQLDVTKNICVQKLVCSDMVNGFQGIDGKCYCYTGYEWDTNKNKCTQKTCGSNQHFSTSNGNCECDNGYVLDNGICINDTQKCINHFGTNVHSVIVDSSGGFTCVCDTEYEWNQNRTMCITPSSINNQQGSGTFSLDLKQGDKNSEVTSLQKLLKSYNYFPYKITGVFSAQTKVALKKFQKNNALKQTGVVDDATRKVLNDLI
jgi:hypothetical protein